MEPNSTTDPEGSSTRNSLVTPRSMRLGARDLHARHSGTVKALLQVLPLAAARDLPADGGDRVLSRLDDDSGHPVIHSERVGTIGQWQLRRHQPEQVGRVRPPLVDLGRLGPRDTRGQRSANTSSVTPPLRDLVFGLLSVDHRTAEQPVTDSTATTGGRLPNPVHQPARTSITPLVTSGFQACGGRPRRECCTRQRVTTSAPGVVLKAELLPQVREWKCPGGSAPDSPSRKRASWSSPRASAGRRLGRSLLTRLPAVAG